MAKKIAGSPLKAKVTTGKRAVVKKATAVVKTTTKTVCKAAAKVAAQYATNPGAAPLYAATPISAHCANRRHFFFCKNPGHDTTL